MCNELHNSGEHSNAVKPQKCFVDYKTWVWVDSGFVFIFGWTCPLIYNCLYMYKLSIQYVLYVKGSAMK